MARIMNHFEISLRWMGSDNPDPIERVCAADLRIQAGQLCLTEIQDLRAQTVRPTIRISAYRLALWFAQNWWRLRWEPEQNDHDWLMSHNIAGAGGGYVWPDLSFIGDGESVLLRMRPGSPTQTEDIRYLVYSDTTVLIEHFVEAVDTFIDTVIARLRASGYPDTRLEQLWNEIGLERNTPPNAKWRKLEALANLDPDASESGYLEQLYGRQEQVGTRAIEELVAAEKGQAPAALTHLLNGCRSAATRLEKDTINSMRLVATDHVRMMPLFAFPGCTKPLPWQLGYGIANIARKHWSLESGKISNFTLGELFGIPDKILDNTIETSSYSLSAGYRDSVSDGMSVWLGKRQRTGRRFALTRLVGDYLCSVEQEMLLPATESKTAQQKFQRAFAQQFLCPVADLLEFLATDKPNDDQIEEAASEFDVSPLLVRSTLVNHHVIGRETLRD